MSFWTLIISDELLISTWTVLFLTNWEVALMNWQLLTDIDVKLKAVIREEYLNSRNFSDDDIFWNLRFHQQHNNTTEAGKWLTRLSESKCRDVTQLQKMVNNFSEMIQLSIAFDQLLLYIELWSALQLDTFYWLLTLKCSEVSTQKV